MYISYFFDLVYYVISSVHIPIILGPNMKLSFSILSLFLVFSIIFIVYIILKFFLTGIIGYEKASVRTAFIHKYQDAKSNIKSGLSKSKGSDKWC